METEFVLSIPDGQGGYVGIDAIKGNKGDEGPPGEVSREELDDRLSNKADRDYVVQEVTKAIAALVDGAPAALDTLKEIAEELKNNETARAALANQLTGKAALSLVEARPVTWLWDGVGTWRPPAAARPGDSVLNLVTSAITQAILP